MASADSAPGGDGGDGGDGGAKDDAVAPDASGCGRYPGAAFCVDFDKTGDLAPSTWSTIETTGPSRTIALTTTAPLSPPNAVVLDLQDAVAGQCKYLRLRKRLTGGTTRTSVHFAVRASTAAVPMTIDFDVTNTLSFSLLVALGKPTLVHFFIQQNDNSNITEVGSADVELTTPLLDRWLEMTMEYTSQPSNLATLTVGSDKLTIPVPSNLVGHDPDIGFGPYCASMPTRFAFDDIAAYLVP